jgi:prepilin-type N-terminal cleavage/methylation domain-containing protein
MTKISTTSKLLTLKNSRDGSFFWILNSGICSQKGFSLIEILVVVAIIIGLASFAVSALSSVAGSRGSIDAAYQISESIELARSEALARRTYVWLGFENTERFGDRNLLLGGVYSKDGSTNTSIANLQPFFRSTSIEKVGLVASVDTGSNNNFEYSNALALQTSQSGIVFSAGPQTFNSKTITFTPSGEAMLSGLPNLNTPFESKILIAIRGFRGTNEITNNDVAVVVEGSTAMPKIYRKQ